MGLTRIQDVHTDWQPGDYKYAPPKCFGEHNKTCPQEHCRARSSWFISNIKASDQAEIWDESNTSALYPRQNLDIVSYLLSLTSDPVTWFMCIARCLMMNDCALNTQFMLFEISSINKEVMAWTSLDARKHTLILTFWHYVEQASPLATKHNFFKAL
jgi:hypothetical protein